VRPWAPLAAAAVLAACAQTGGLADIAPGQRPPPASDEAGLWLVMDRVEAQIKTSGRLIRDPALDRYLHGIVCRLVPRHCGDIRIYVVDVPAFNASMAPNGALQLWGGTLLRVHDEAQLAYVLGHEVGHFLRRHSLALWRDARSKSDALVFVQVATAAAGIGYVGSVAQVIAIGSFFAFSRDNEREADEIGLGLVAAAGYDASRAAPIWTAMMAEQKVLGKDEPSLFLATHPAGAERQKTLAALAKRYHGGERGRARFLAVVLPLRARLLRQELRKRRFAATELVLDGLASDGARPGEIAFFRAEIRRLRHGEGDAEAAVTLYRAALAGGDAPPETYRSLGLVLLSLDRRKAARDAFERYLAAVPEAEDRRLIERYLEDL